MANSETRSVTKKETNLMKKASKIIPVPEILKMDLNKKEIDMKFIEGRKLSEHLDNLSNAEEVCRKIGINIAKLHDINIIHGDLTTSNMILTKDNVLYFIDFGLGFESSKIEDKAVDLHLIKQALEAKHFNHFEKFFHEVLEGYKASKKFDEVISRLKKVEARGRYKQAG